LHPLGLYNKSLNQVIEGFSEVLVELELVKEELEPANVHSELPKFNSNKLLRAQKELLYSIRSHIDVSYHILKATNPYPPDMDKFNSKTKKSMESSPFQWLIHTNYNTVFYFKSNIQEYKTFLDLIVNKLKHEHARLRDIIYIDDFEKRIGYFVEGSGADENGKVFVGPDTEIHPKGVVFSYSRDLAFHFYKIYEISHHLKNALIISFKDQHNRVIADDFYLKEDSSKFVDIAYKICKLNLRFFPKEYFKPVPIIDWNPDINTLFLLLDEEFKLNSDLSGSIRKIVNWTGDSTTKKFRFPRG